MHARHASGVPADFPFPAPPLPTRHLDTLTWPAGLLAYLPGLPRWAVSIEVRGRGGSLVRRVMPRPRDTGTFLENNDDQESVPGIS